MEYLEEIIRTSEPRRHKYYNQTVLHAREMGVHIEGFRPDKLLDEKRPNEPKEVRDYRLAVWKAVTKSLSSKIINTVNRIFNPRFFRVEFEGTPKIVKEENSLGTYLMGEFGIYQNIWIYIRETLLKLTFSDPNAVCVVLPESYEIQEGEYFKPIPVIFRANEVVDFKDGEYYTMYQPPIERGGVRRTEGLIYYFDKDMISIHKTNGSKIELVFEYDHNFGFVPAFRLGGQAEGERNPYYYSSFVAGIAPHWDKAVTMISDLDGSTVNHLFPSMWEWTDDCDTCGAKGRLTRTGELWEGQDTTETIPCTRCKGTGLVTNKSPFGIHQVKRDALNPDLPSPIPPAGFISKDIAPLQELKKSIETEIVAGFSSVNMEILAKIGENQSGIAKTIDRQDFDSFLMRISQHVFEYQLPQIIKAVSYWRYSALGQYVKDIVEGVTISKPKEFSVLGVSFIMEELKAASGQNVSVSYLKQLETELVNTKFANNEWDRKFNIAVIELKPFPNRTPEQLRTLVETGAIRKIDFIRNENVDDLVTMAVTEDEKFLDFTFEKQLEVIERLILEKYEEKPELPPTPPIEELEEIT